MTTTVSGASLGRITDYTRPRNIMDGTAGKQTTGAMNYVKRGSAAGANTIVGGMKTATGGTATTIGMIATTTATNFK
jgi:hypothetical protein